MGAWDLQYLYVYHEDRSYTIHIQLQVSSNIQQTIYNVLFMSYVKVITLLILTWYNLSVSYINLLLLEISTTRHCIQKHKYVYPQQSESYQDV